MEQLELQMDGQPEMTEAEKFRFSLSFALDFLQRPLIQRMIQKQPADVLRAVEEMENPAGQASLVAEFWAKWGRPEGLRRLEGVVLKQGKYWDLLRFAKNVPGSDVLALQARSVKMILKTEASCDRRSHYLLEWARIPGHDPTALMLTAQKCNMAKSVLSIFLASATADRMQCAAILIRMKDLQCLQQLMDKGHVGVSDAEELIVSSARMDMGMICSFARDFPGANVSRLEKIVFEKGSRSYKDLFKKHVPGAKLIADVDTVAEVLES